jgi:electron transport complex protein RnfE
MSILSELKRAIVYSNPVFVLLLGLCPTLAITTSVENALGMGICVIFVLILSNVTISAVRNFIPNQVRIACYIVIIATYVTVVNLAMEAFLPSLYQQLGLFLELIVVNCIVLGRAEAFASRNPVSSSLIDGVGVGIGWTGAALLVSFIRGLTGDGSIIIWGDLAIEGILEEPATLMSLPYGGFLTVGVLLAIFAYIGRRDKRRELKEGS